MYKNKTKQFEKKERFSKTQDYFFTLSRNLALLLEKERDKEETHKENTWTLQFWLGRWKGRFFNINQERTWRWKQDTQNQKKLKSTRQLVCTVWQTSLLGYIISPKPTKTKRGEHDILIITCTTSERVPSAFTMSGNVIHELKVFFNSPRPSSQLHRLILL